ncbi:MAG: hypothetical protein FJ011_09855 [Chloroflexi bacterium]|nr:hypothetical protein [Chloroflexota bacterium]
MRRVLVFLTLVAVLAMAIAAPAQAGLTWCLTDPNIKLADGGVVHLWVGVAPENKNTGFTLTIVAPAGSRVVGNSQKLNMTVVLQDSGPAGEITAWVDAGFDVSYAVKFRSQVLGEGLFEGAHTWSW